jgi:hypothetical protein
MAHETKAVTHARVIANFRCRVGAFFRGHEYEVILRFSKKAFDAGDRTIEIMVDRSA